MADTWYEYAQGSPEQRLADLEKQRKEFDALKSDPRWGSLSPRQKMLAAGDTLYPTRTTDAAEDLSNAATYALDAGVRPRDTAIRAVQELASGHPVNAAGLALAAVPSAVVPSLAAGTPGSEDDWRKHGNPAVAFGLDMLTDPANYAGVGLIGRGLKKVAAGAGDAADTIRKLRYSADLSGVPAWAADDIASGLPRAVPESSLEAMLQARRMVRTPGRTEVDVLRPPVGHVGYRDGVMNTPLLPHEWDRWELARFTKGLSESNTPLTHPNIPHQYRNIGMFDRLRPYSGDADEARAIRRQAAAAAILDKGRQNPDIMAQLPAVFRLPVSDDLIARLAAEAQNPLIPIAQGAAIGGGAALGGGLAYGLLGEE